MERNRKNHTVVIIEDDADLLKLIVVLFKRKGFDIEQFTTGSTALAYLSTPENLKQIGLIVLDRMLPDMDGLDLLKQLRHSHQIPVLILSALSTEKDILEGLKKGATDYITKPFSMSILMEKAERLISR